ncbi:uncharacterized protein LOC114396747 [Glycine soja]|uniref:PRC-barrel domain-containing protein n=1 Tax=Glycine soja TaxID=3848 RepID=A0A445FVU4_GLYSO|nr:uncharacterized protein LOC114396747 [Glycine soja]KAG4922248.1 hypothetical protein JHK86_051061 [Glycine max]KHN40640.1 hypothetical protein glysoja_001138 [Glycine soja]RZB53037.1 hypothetical protein D0Y65_049190 [Glycine soja]
MPDFLATNPLTISAAESPRFPFLHSCPTLTPRPQLNPNFRIPFSPKPSKNKSVSLALSSRSNEGSSRGYGFYNELEFEDRKDKTFGLEMNPVVGEDSQSETGSIPFDGVEGGDDKGEDDLVRAQGDADGDGDGLKKGYDDEEGENEKFGGKLRVRRGKEVIRRSNLLAKQVISIHSALSLGFVSQLWVDTSSWMVLFVEVRPNLLSGDSEKFLLDDISQVGDVVLVQDESVTDNEFKMVGLETLVGYKVVTPSRRNIGKVRGYTFSINSGAVEELELDSFGLSIIPSSLVSTYSLLVEDVLEVVSDAVVVHEAAALRIQRLSKGFLGNQNVRISVDDFEDFDSEQSDTYGPISRRRKSFGRKKPSHRDWDDEDNWELPMDYL